MLKDDKLQTEETNNPLNDSIKAKDLFHDEMAAFVHLPPELKDIYYLLLHDTREFHAFFSVMKHRCDFTDVASRIARYFKGHVCEAVSLDILIKTFQIELAYCLSLIQSLIHHEKNSSITPAWVLRNYPKVEQIMFLLRNTPGEEGCDYCTDKLNIVKVL